MDLILNYVNLVVDVFTQNMFWQIVWLIAFCISIYNFLFCKDKKFILVVAIASLVWWIHFMSIWLITAWLINFIDVFKNALALKYKKSNKIVITFVIFYIIVWILSYDWYISLIPTINALLSTFLVFYIRWVWLNLWFMFVVSLWWIYNFIGQSIWWLSTDITLFVVWTIWIIRIILSDKKNNNKNDKEVEKEIKSV